ncbi:Gfo/Idh/MocA family protein [Propionivibrio dicarboxylicus]|uniref:Predicted dehydrogenase n=1 Tax=Propionivibrio dicarboxylicus TaxID=83767 RepID=A0A1G8JCT2_9RHOO|nr:Gfo/Idh/MocA family oxidoreductase [Propionivibrio dicarboxylicus]SDI28777.1 Predicted dehydrogenase [Propionivibrio dicarboxylicus]
MPVLIEPPLADAPDMVSGLIRCVEASGVPVLVGHRRRYSPIIDEARRIIRDGRLGRLVSVMGSATFARPASDFQAAPWRRQKEGGPILSELADEIDTLRVLAGEIVDVQAIASHAVRGFDVEDTVAISLRFASGALGTFMLSDCAAGPFNWTQASGESVGHAQAPGANCYVLSGTRGTLSLPGLRLLTHPGAPSWRSPLVEATLMRAEADPLRRQLDHFCRVVRRTSAPLCTVQDAARTLAGVLAVARAAETGERVVLA